MDLSIAGDQLFLSAHLDGIAGHGCLAVLDFSTCSRSIYTCHVISEDDFDLVNLLIARIMSALSQGNLSASEYLAGYGNFVLLTEVHNNVIYAVAFVTPSDIHTCSRLASMGLRELVNRH